MDPWINLFEEFLDSKKVKIGCDNDLIHAEMVIDKDTHVFLCDKTSKEHTYIIF